MSPSNDDLIRKSKEQAKVNALALNLVSIFEKALDAIAEINPGGIVPYRPELSDSPLTHCTLKVVQEGPIGTITLVNAEEEDIASIAYDEDDFSNAQLSTGVSSIQGRASSSKAEPLGILLEGSQVLAAYFVSRGQLTVCVLPDPTLFSVNALLLEDHIEVPGVAAFFEVESEEDEVQEF
jgi:hypothetical protein